MLNGIKKILIIRFNGVGDIVMTMPSLRAIREAYPAARITWLVDERCKDAICFEPMVDEVISLHRKQLDQMPRFQALKKLLGLLGDLRRARYDLVVDLQGFSETAWLAWVVGRRYRVGHRVKPGIVDRAKFQGFQYNVPVKLPDRTLHRVEYFFEIARGAGAEVRDPGLFFHVPPAKSKFADNFLKIHGVKKSDRLVALNPGPAGTDKCWSPENFAALADLLAKKLKVKVLLRGSPGDEGLIDRIRDLMLTKSLSASPTDLQELAALAARCRVFVSNDTGPMHIAAAVGTPTLGLFGMTHPELSGPWGFLDCSLTVPDYKQHGDMDRITPEMALERVREMMSKVKSKKVKGKS